jgi:hypothetical protein
MKPLGTGTSLWPITPTDYPNYTAKCMEKDSLMAWWMVESNRDAFSHITHTFTHEDQGLLHLRPSSSAFNVQFLTKNCQIMPHIPMSSKRCHGIKSGSMLPDWHQPRNSARRDLSHQPSLVYTTAMLCKLGAIVVLLMRLEITHVLYYSTQSTNTGH